MRSVDVHFLKLLLLIFTLARLLLLVDHLLELLLVLLEHGVEFVFFLGLVAALLSFLVLRLLHDFFVLGGVHVCLRTLLALHLFVSLLQQTLNSILGVGLRGLRGGCFLLLFLVLGLLNVLRVLDLLDFLADALLLTTGVRSFHHLLECLDIIAVSD